MKTNRFIDRNLVRMSSYEDMVRKLSQKTHLTRSAIESIGQRTFEWWEEKEHQDPNTLIFQSEKERKKQIQNILGYFKYELEPLIPSNDKIEDTISIIRDSLDEIFELE